MVAFLASADQAEGFANAGACFSTCLQHAELAAAAALARYANNLKKSSFSVLAAVLCQASPSTSDGRRCNADDGHGCLSDRPLRAALALECALACWHRTWYVKMSAMFTLMSGRVTSVFAVQSRPPTDQHQIRRTSRDFSKPRSDVESNWHVLHNNSSLTRC
jgi:hypothetical protein